MQPEQVKSYAGRFQRSLYIAHAFACLLSADILYCSNVVCRIGKLQCTEGGGGGGGGGGGSEGGGVI